MSQRRNLAAASLPLLLLVLLRAPPAASAAALFSMPWLCLERCGDSPADIAAQLAQLAGPHRDDFTAASFELFNLGPNSSLVVNNLTSVAAQLGALGLQTHAMVSSYPYPPEFLTWMRQVFAAPQPFFDALAAAVLAANISAVNIDWEPTSGHGAPPLTKQDPVDYANFLDALAGAMHAHGVLVSVDVATWSDIWDLPRIAATRVDYVMNMETYVVNDTVWLQEFADSLALIPREKLVVGLENHENLSDASLKLRFDAMAAASPPVRSIGIWRAGIEDSWWPFLDAFAAGSAAEAPPAPAATDAESPVMSLPLSAAEPALPGGLAFLTFEAGTYDVELAVFDLAKKAPESLFNFSSEEFESGYWVESAIVAGNSSTVHATWVSNVQYDSNQTQGALLQIELTDRALRWVNATYCWAMFLDARDASGYSVLCVADNAMDSFGTPRTRSRGRRAAAGKPLRRQPAHGAAPPPRGEVAAPAPPADTRDVLVFLINRLTGAESTVGRFAVGLEEDIAVTYDAKRGVIWAMLQNDATNANSLVGFDVAKGQPLPNPAPVAYDKIFYAMQWDASLDKIVAVASTWDAAKQAWNTGFGSIAPQTAAFAPIGLANGTFAALRQFNDIDVVVPSLGIFFLTCFDWVLPDTTLYIVGVSTATGAIVYKEPVRNPFIDISYIATWQETPAPAAAAAQRAQLAGLATDAFTTQLSFYSAATGLFGDPAVNDPFWTTANALANAATLYELTGDTRPFAVLQQSFDVLVPAYATPKRGNDDLQWHAHAWLRAYEITGNATYLNESLAIYNDLFDPASPWHGWNQTCGGMNWWSNNPYVNTITNGLALTGLVSLQRATGSTAPLQGKPLLEWAQLIWQWAQRPGLLSADGVFLDGFGSDCVTAGGAPWTYNSGIWLDGLTGLSIALADASFSDSAFALAQAAAAYFAGGNADGVMRELSCGNGEGACGGADGREFKGVFARHLGYALRDWAAPGTSATNAAAAAWARAWILRQSAALLANDAGSAPGGTVLFGQLWQGPYASDNTPWISHSAGNDVVLAALGALAV